MFDQGSTTMPEVPGSGTGRAAKRLFGGSVLVCIIGCAAVIDEQNVNSFQHLGKWLKAGSKMAVREQEFHTPVLLQSGHYSRREGELSPVFIHDHTYMALSALHLMPVHGRIGVSSRRRRRFPPRKSIFLIFPFFFRFF